MILHVIPPLPETADALKAIHHRMSPNRGALLEFEARSEFTSLRESEERRGHLALKTTLQALNHTMFGRLVAPEVNSALLEGDPAVEIIDFAHKTVASLIVAGSRGLSQVKGWLLGSVSRKLIQFAPCSVLLVRGVISSGEKGEN